MKEHNDNLQSETIDHVIEGGGLSQQDRQTSRLIQNLHTYSQEYAQENERSLDRIWSRMVQSQEHSVSLQAAWKRPEKRLAVIKEIKTMEENNLSWGMNPPHSQAKKRRSFLRTLGIGLAAAVAIIAILSFAVFSTFQHPASQTAGNGSSTITGGAGHPQQIQQQKVISSGKQVCNLNAGSKVSINGAPWTPQLAWSAQGQIGVTTYSNVKAYSAKDCGAAFSASSSIQQAYGPVWSPDGKKLALVDAGDNSIHVLDNHGNSIAHLTFSQLGTLGVGNLFWSSDSNKIMFASQDASQQESVKSIDLTSNGKAATMMMLPANSGVISFSANGKVALLSHTDMSARPIKKDTEVWDVNSEKKLSSYTQQPIMNAALSPDGALIAIDGANSVQIYTTADGKLQASFQNTVSGQGVHTIVWSPDGKYIADATNVIKVYDVNAKKIAATFGQVDSQHWITTLTWAPDSSGLASSTLSLKDDVPSATDNTVNVWALS